MKVRNLILLTMSIILLGSCAKDSGMRITTNTFANKEIIPKGFQKNDSFSITTKQKGDELFAKEVSQKIATVLEDRGFVVKTDGDADFNLNFSFGMEKSTHTRDVPVYIPDYGYWCYHHCCRYGCGYTIAYVPEEYTIFNKILLVEVYKNGKKIPVWQGTARSYEEHSDLRDSIDYLLITVFKNFGKNTQKYIKSKMERNDQEVIKLRQRYFKPIGYVEKK